jgi:gluconolactonase
VLSRVRPDTGRVETVADTAGGPNGAVLAADGGFVVTQNGGLDFSVFEMFDPVPPPPRLVPSGLQRVAPDGSVSYLASGMTQQPNDLCVGRDGTVYFTDPPGYPPPDPPSGRVLALAPDGAVRVVADGFWYANGIALDVDGETLILVENGRAGRDEAFVRLRADGTREPFAVGCHGDGCALDVDGRIYMAGGGHLVTVYEPDGSPVEELALPGDPVPATNCCFGGPDLRTLFAVDAGSPGRVYAFTDMPTRGVTLDAWPVP